MVTACGHMLANLYDSMGKLAHVNLIRDSITREFTGKWGGTEGESGESE